MKIKAFIFNLSKGGAQGIFVNVVNHLFDSKKEIEVVTQNLNDAVYLDDLNPLIKVTNLNLNNPKKMIIDVFKYVKNNDFDCALVFSQEIAVYLYLAKTLLHKKFIIVGRCLNTISKEYTLADSRFRKYVTHSFIKIFYHRIDYVIAQSEGMANDLIRNYSFRSENVFVINNPMAPKFEKKSFEKKLEVNKKNYLLYVGRLESQKGLDLLIKAFKKINNYEIELLLIGDGSQKENLILLTNKLNIEHRVKFIPFTKNIIPYYEAARATVLSSYYEGFPNVLVESIACGTPVVSFDSPSGPSDIIIDNVNGYLVEYLNVDALSKAMQKVILQKWDPLIIKKTAERYKNERIMYFYDKMFNIIESKGRIM